MKNKLTDLNDHLFAQLERLGDESINEKDLAKETNRTKAIVEISKVAINNARLVLDAEKFVTEYNHNPSVKNMDNMLISKK